MGIILLAIIIGGGFFLVGWLYNKAQDEKEKRQSDEWETRRLSDESVLELQATFERRLDRDADLPTGVVWKKAYIYRHLMSKRFAALIAKHRYDDAISTKIKTDWINYLSLLEIQSTEKILSGESSDEKEREAHGAEAWRIRQQFIAIEDGFAAAMGEEATKELQQVRAAPHDSIDRSGRKPMAPEGFRYSPVSIHPYDEELKPR